MLVTVGTIRAVCACQTIVQLKGWLSGVQIWFRCLTKLVSESIFQNQYVNQLSCRLFHLYDQSGSIILHTIFLVSTETPITAASETTEQ